jgi:hypothetical protein
MVGRALLAGALALSLCACSTANLRHVAEKGDTDASLAYAAIATTVNAYEARPGADLAKGEALKLKAWEALALERQVYAATGTVDLTALTTLVAAAKALGN